MLRTFLSLLFAGIALSLFFASFAAAQACEDYSTAVLNDPWDMNSSTDINNYVKPADFTGFANVRFADGQFMATAANGDPYFHLLSPALSSSQPSGGRFGSDYPIDTSRYRYLVIRMYVSTPSFMQIVWNRGVDYFPNFTISKPVTTTAGWNTYEIDLNTVGVMSYSGSTAPWNAGGVTGLRLDPTVAAGSQVSIDWIGLYTRPGCNSSSAQGPQVTMLQPDAKGGQGLYAWNMNGVQDIALIQGLDTAEILPFNSVNGIAGDFFHGANTAGNRDPVNYSAFFTINPAQIDTSVFHRLTYKLLVTGGFDIVEGSVARVYWSDAATRWGQSQDIVVFEGWNEYTVDLATIGLESGSAPWSGVVNSFRVDSHEFLGKRDYYFDYIHLRTDDRANSKFAVTLSAFDPDTPASGVSVSLYYTPTRSTSGGTLISTFPLSSFHGVYIWDTSKVAPGSYYVYAVVSDGVNITRRLSTGKVVVTRNWNDAVLPIIGLETPLPGHVFGSNFQVKGYALDDIQLAQLQVYIGGTQLGRLHPSAYSPAARASFPNHIDSSNAGFNAVFDTRSIPDGVHTALIRGIDTSGNIKDVSVPVRKSATASPGLIGDAVPNGRPIPVPATRTPTPKPPAPQTPAPPTVRTPVLSGFSVSKRGVVRGKISRLSAGCAVGLYGGGSKAANAPILGFTATSTDAFIVGAQLPPYSGTYYLRARQNCGAGEVRSSAKKMSFSRKRKLRPTTLLQHLQAKLRKV